MSEPAQPLSRRERRALEEAALAAQGEVTQPLPIAPETTSIMSRRERRRLERLTNPLETWTEEEELIATGQMPAMTPEVIAEQERLAAAAAYEQAQPDAVAEAEPDAVAEAEPVWEPQASAIPEDLRHLFPPGSLQAGASEPQQAPPDSALVEEIRQLSHEAMADITRATAQPVTDVPAFPEGVDVEALWNAPTVDEPVREPVDEPQERSEEPIPHEPVSLEQAPFVQELPVPVEPHRGDGPGVAPVWSTLVPAVPTPVRGQQPTVAPATEEQPSSLWSAHPLMGASPSPVRELPAEPAVRELPRPDLSALLNTQANPTVGQQALRSTEPLTTTGTLPQRVAEPQPGGGTRHFRWAHLAVIGAIAFVLGVLAWNIARSGS